MTEERETCDWCGEKLQDVQPLCSCCVDDTNNFHGQDRDESHWA
jgi:predicted amidophosphoribosyltransferase